MAKKIKSLLEHQLLFIDKAKQSGFKHCAHLINNGYISLYHLFFMNRELKKLGFRIEYQQGYTLIFWE